MLSVVDVFDMSCDTFFFTLAHPTSPLLYPHRENLANQSDVYTMPLVTSGDNQHLKGCIAAKLIPKWSFVKSPKHKKKVPPQKKSYFPP